LILAKSTPGLTAADDLAAARDDQTPRLDKRTNLSYLPPVQERIADIEHDRSLAGDGSGGGVRPPGVPQVDLMPIREPPKHETVELAEPGQAWQRLDVGAESRSKVRRAAGHRGDDLGDTIARQTFHQLLERGPLVPRQGRIDDMSDAYHSGRSKSPS